jgi:penicillin amidase
MKKIVFGLFALIVIAIVSIFIYLKSTVKDYNQDIQLTGLHEASEVIFDDYGIPHIYAENDEDAFRILGYVQASDRLFQLELLRRVGGGQLSEILGEKLIPTDKYIRTVGLNENAIRAAQAFEKEAPKDIKKNIYAFIDGINQYIHNGKTPIEFHIIGIPKTEFTLTDMYRILGYMGFSFSMELRNEPLLDWINQNLGSQYLNELSLSHSPHDVHIPTEKVAKDSNDFTSISEHVGTILETLPVPIFYGSNSWVISGKKTKSGKVLFANDTHIGFSQPSVWYEAHIETPQLKLYGNFLAGVPYPLVAHNDHHSWGLTIFPADATDLYHETIKDGKVLYKNEWTDLIIRPETLNVKDQDPVIFDVTSTPHGPIISNLDKFKEDLNNPVSMWFVANHVTDQKIYAIAKLSTSKKFSDFEKAAKGIDSPGLNIMYGDIDGNIGWYGAAKLIKRPQHVQSKLILNGSTGTDDPLGFYDFSLNPKNINPKTGFVVSANNQPDSVNGIYYPGYYFLGARYKVISEAILDKNDWDIEAMKNLVMNDQSPFYPENVSLMAPSIQPDTELEQLVLDKLNSWTGAHDQNQICPTIYYKLIYNLLNSTLIDEMGERRFELFLSTHLYLRSISPLLENDTSLWWDNIQTKNIETKNEIIDLAFKQSVKDLTQQLGNDLAQWNWGKVHFIEHPHPIGKEKPMDRIFNVGPFPAGGGEEVINKIAFKLNPEGIYISRSGPAMRILLDFNDLENSESINPTGASGNMMNPHYEDQALMYVNGKFRKQKMIQSDILENHEGIWHFTGN